MSTNHMASDERVSSRVNEEVRTPIGDVFVTYNPTSGTVIASFHCDMPERVRYDTVVTDGSPELRVRLGRRPPHIGDEVTQNGRTFEVEGVRMTHGNRVQIHGDNGVWEDWKEQ